MGHFHFSILLQHSLQPIESITIATETHFFIFCVCKTSQYTHFIKTVCLPTFLRDFIVFMLIDFLMAFLLWLFVISILFVRHFIRYNVSNSKFYDATQCYILSVQYHKTLFDRGIEIDSCFYSVPLHQFGSLILKIIVHANAVVNKWCKCVNLKGGYLEIFKSHKLDCEIKRYITVCDVYVDSYVCCSFNKIQFW